MVKEGIKLSMFKKITLKINIANNNINKNLGVPPPKCGVALFALLGSSLPLLTHTNVLILLSRNGCYPLKKDISQNLSILKEKLLVNTEKK
jgi:hypothetical protein